jgi:hypothetical protein
VSMESECVWVVMSADFEADADVDGVEITVVMVIMQSFWQKEGSFGEQLALRLPSVTIWSDIRWSAIVSAFSK